MCSARRGELVRELLRVRVTLDLALTGRRDDPEAVVTQLVGQRLSSPAASSAAAQLPKRSRTVVEHG
jgi:hypothetical protein